MKSILITNATTINEGRSLIQDVRIKDGRIDTLGTDLSARKTDQIIDAKGLFLLPGMIDDQVHFREPGLTHKGTIASESRAAVAGGITSFMDMPNTIAPTTTMAALVEKYRIAETSAFSNYGFYFGATNDNIEAIKRLDPEKICGLKVFMGASTGNLLVDDPDVLEAIFSQSPVRVAVHCEDTPLIDAQTRHFKGIYGDAVPVFLHPVIRSQAACFKSSALAVELAKKHGTWLHVLHVSTEKELSLFSDAPIREKRITAEVCVHHLFFSDADYNMQGARIKCNPAIKTEKDRRALLTALKTGKLDVVGTDHAPHTLSEKQQPYLLAPSGLPLVQHALICLLEHVHNGDLSLETVVQRTSHGPAELFGIRERGYIREGFWADLVLVDMNQSTRVDDDPVYYHCGWTPFSGQTFRSRIVATLVSGHLAFLKGRLDPTPAGKPLVFTGCSLKTA
ncbi:dihydroorotase [Desulfosarcina sp. OttesenSCG-928-B08]|nr:dihydroorotase [Desulfosarcina sp. OttesenSCG-928-B08]